MVKIFSSFSSDIFSPTVQAQAHYAKNGFAEDTAVHLAFTQSAINENNGYFFDFEAAFVGSEFHFNLERISFKADGVKVNGFQNLTLVTFESCRCVMNGQAGDNAYVFEA